MVDEKPKKKPKRKPFSRSQKILLAALPLIATVSVLLLIYFAIPVQLQLNDVQAVTITDRWGGLGIPTLITYNLTMTEGSLAGPVTFGAGFDMSVGDMTLAATREDTVSIPPQIVAAFLEKLEESRLRPGQYTPNIQWTDDYPSITISLQTASGTIEVYSQSQAEEHIPWGADVQGRTYVINSGIPAQALAILAPYLKREILDELMNE